MCLPLQGHFPEPDKDPVIQIASLVTVQGQTGPVVKNILTLKSCAPIIGAEVMSFEREGDLLRRWRVRIPFFKEINKSYHCQITYCVHRRRGSDVLRARGRPAPPLAGASPVLQQLPFHPQMPHIMLKDSVRIPLYRRKWCR